MRVTDTLQTEFTELPLEPVETLLGKEEVLKKIEALYGLSTIKSWHLELFNPGKRFKRIFKLTLSDGSKIIHLILKFHKRNVAERFEREIGPRQEPDFIPFAPVFFGSYSRVRTTRRNQEFTDGDYRVIIEDYIDGEDLIDTFTGTLTDDQKWAATEQAVLLYERIGERSIPRGWQLNNVNPRNVRFPHGGGSPLVVDWGGQTTNIDPHAYQCLIRDRLWECFLGVGLK